jgi:hypothetical protein
MVLLQKGTSRFRCPTAFIATLQDARQADVASKDDVVAFLKNHPDQNFFLMCGDRTVETVDETIEPDKVVYCGMVRWSSKRKALENQPFGGSKTP